MHYSLLFIYGRYITGPYQQMDFFTEAKQSLGFVSRQERGLILSEIEERAERGATGLTCTFIDQIGDDCWRNKGAVVQSEAYEEGVGLAHQANRARDLELAQERRISVLSRAIDRLTQPGMPKEKGQAPELPSERIARFEEVEQHSLDGAAAAHARFLRLIEAASAQFDIHDSQQLAEAGPQC